MTDSLVPPSFEVPRTYAWSEFHLEPLGEQHNDRDHAAWMSSIDHIRSTPGFGVDEEPDWPVTMTLEANLEDLVRHAKDFEERRGFTYSILDGDDVIGCIYIYRGRLPGYDAEVSSWVRESRAELDTAVRGALSAWIHEAWPFSNPYYAGRE
ncbi:MAG: N-acetyltransferase [Acidimicrobiia bacterium]